MRLLRAFRRSSSAMESIATPLASDVDEFIDRRTCNMFAALNATTFAATLLVNAAFSSGIKGVSDRYRTYLTPEGYAFSIWGAIYSLVALFVVWQCFPSAHRDEVLARVSVWFSAANILSGLWMVAFTRGTPALWMWVAAAMLSGMTTCLARVHYNMQWWTRWHSNTPPTTLICNRMAVEILCLEIPFSLYVAWTAIAFMLNFTIALTASGWDGLGLRSDLYAVVLLSLIAFAYIVWCLAKSNFICGVVYVWGAFAIRAAARQSCPERIVGPDISQEGCDRVAVAACVLAGAVAFVALAALVRWAFRVRAAYAAAAARPVPLHDGMQQVDLLA